jgi:hypothetical protein
LTCIENRRHLSAAGLLSDCAQIAVPSANHRKTKFTFRIALILPIQQARRIDS